MPLCYFLALGLHVSVFDIITFWKWTKKIVYVVEIQIKTLKEHGQTW